MRATQKCTWLFAVFAVIAAVALALGLAGTALAAGGGGGGGGGGACPSINAIGNFQTSTIVAANFSIAVTCSANGDDGLCNTNDLNEVGNPDVATYTLSTTDQGAPAIGTVGDGAGVPGVITYCVYPNQPPGNPASATADAAAFTNDGSSFKTSFGSIQGFFAFTRNDGNPSNIPMNAATAAASPITVGTGTWAYQDAPSTQTIVLHINDTAECTNLYGLNQDGSAPETCFVKPSSELPSPKPLCNGNPACKEVVIAEACSDPLTVPAFTPLTIAYTYVIVNNNPAGGINMEFDVPVPGKTKDINGGGGKDYFGCEQIPGTPAFPTSVAFTSQSTNGTNGTFALNFTQGGGVQCSQSRFTLTASGSTIVLAPGDSLTFGGTMTTRVNKGGLQEYTSTGSHFLNSGFNVKWIEPVSSGGDGLQHSFTTNPPITVNVVNQDCSAP